MALPRRRSRPGLASDPTLYLGIWLAGDPDVVEISRRRMRCLATRRAITA